ncbi:prisilkin-39 [Drosophila serrata]|uniref:prisilkin-39 n=1 Tax=Drosophila serrata TaxID=7274 RepID=UPI000A1D2DB2|nr:prisilkin-39 [Drosophila serrata]
MRTRAYLLAILALLTACCLDWTNALFFKSWKTGRGYGGVQNYGYNGYGNYGYSNYAAGYGYPSYPGYSSYSYPSSPAYSSYSYPSYPGYSSQYNPYRGRRTSGQRQGRTYSEIQRVIKPDGYVGLGASRFLPARSRFSPLWG